MVTRTGTDSSATRSVSIRKFGQLLYPPPPASPPSDATLEKQGTKNKDEMQVFVGLGRQSEPQHFHENLRLTRSQDFVLILFSSAKSSTKLYDALLKNGFPAP